MRVVAITEDEKCQIVTFQGQKYWLKMLRGGDLTSSWRTIKSTKEEWIVVKWILDYNMKIPQDYPTIDQIKRQQR